jgi:hypothetical protein
MDNTSFPRIDVSTSYPSRKEREIPAVVVPEFLNLLIGSIADVGERRRVGWRIPKGTTI